MTFKPTRRAVVGGLAGSMALNLRAFGQTLTMPTSPVTLNFVDVAGNLALTQKAIEAYRDKNPKLVSKVNFTKAPAPELPGKIKAQQDAGRVDIDGVLTGIDALSAGVDQKLWIPIADRICRRSCRSSTTSICPAPRRCRAWRRTRASASCSARPAR